jgi:hypothetical protein
MKAEIGTYSYVIQYFDKKATKKRQLLGHVNLIY